MVQVQEQGQSQSQPQEQYQQKKMDSEPSKGPRKKRIEDYTLFDKINTKDLNINKNTNVTNLSDTPNVTNYLKDNSKKEECPTHLSTWSNPIFGSEVNVNSNISQNTNGNINYNQYTANQNMSYQIQNT